MPFNAFFTCQIQNFRNGTATVTKTFTSNVIPHKGDVIIDTVWKADDEQVVDEVAINYADEECYVYLPKIVLETNDKEYLDDYIKMTKSHGWEAGM